MKKKLYKSSPNEEYQGLDSTSDPLEDALWEERRLLNSNLDFVIEDEEDVDETVEDSFDDQEDDYPQWNNLN